MRSGQSFCVSIHTMHEPFLQQKLEAIEVGNKPISRLLDEMGRMAFQDGGRTLAQTLDLMGGYSLEQRHGTRRASIEKFYYPHKYSLQFSTDAPQWGGLSGCTLDETVSWGKVVGNEGSRVTCYCDTSIALPLFTHALNECVERRSSVPDLDW